MVKGVRQNAENESVEDQVELVLLALEPVARVDFHPNEPGYKDECKLKK
jgi:hypothetical protein